MRQTLALLPTLLVSLLVAQNASAGIWLHFSKEQWAAAKQEAKCAANRGWKAYNETECSNHNKTTVSWRPEVMHPWTRKEVDEMVQEAKDSMNGYWETKRSNEKSMSEKDKTKARKKQQKWFGLS